MTDTEEELVIPDELIDAATAMVSKIMMLMQANPGLMELDGFMILGYVHGDIHAGCFQLTLEQVNRLLKETIKGNHYHLNEPRREH
jgi:hypothetical protein